MLPERGKADRAARNYLHLRMRPLSADASRPPRRRGGNYTVAAVTLGCLAGVLIVLVSVIFFLANFGDPYPLAFVERRLDGFYAQLRACESDPIHLVQVYPYDDRTEQPDPVWVATRSGPRVAESVRLFAAQPGFDTTAIANPTPTLYEVTINEGYESVSSVVVDERGLEVGQVDFGGDPVPRPDYEAMKDSDFGCPPR